MLYLYAIFHCNLAFSAIPREHYPRVINNCYWPLLRLCEKGYPLAIEMPAWTLSVVNESDPKFIKTLSSLWREGSCEFVGSGYSQAIFPLIPAEVNGWNLEAGNRHYERLLGRRPLVAFVNEQTYSSGLVRLYREAGYRAIVMEWNNCQRYNFYPPEYLYHPQRAIGAGEGKERPVIDLLWNNSISFQKFQRCVHGQLTEDDYFEYLLKHLDASRDRAFPLYGNDAEVFDYRPGDACPPKGEEHRRMERLLRRVAGKKGLKLVTPSEALGVFDGAPGAFNALQLESVETPVPCKKQEKYNPVRWAVTGRDDTHINAQCHQVYEKIKKIEALSLVDARVLDGHKETLCFLWSSDFRTTTTDEKFLSFQNRMGWVQVETDRLLGGAKKRTNKARAAGGRSSVMEDADAITLQSRSVRLELLKRKGLAIKGLTFPAISERPLLGTLPHGYYEDIEFGADFFSGHMINVHRDGRKVTDLVPVEPRIEKSEGGVKVTCSVPLEVGTLVKSYSIDFSKPEVMLTYNLRCNGLSASSLRLGIFTFVPDAFDHDALAVCTTNGGRAAERYRLRGHTVLHDEPVSPSISAASCLGATEGWLSLGDGVKSVIIETDKSKLYSVPMLRYQETGGSFFLRVLHSIGEIDDTAFSFWRGHNSVSFSIRAMAGPRGPATRTGSR